MDAPDFQALPKEKREQAPYARSRSLYLTGRIYTCNARSAVAASAASLVASV